MKHLFCFLFTISLLPFSLHMNAQNYKCESNQCTIKASGNYKIELACCTNYLDIYVLDQEGLPLENVIITGTAEFFYLDETSLITNFKQFFRTNSLRAHVPANGFYNCKVKLVVNNQIIEIYFDNEHDMKNKN